MAITSTKKLLNIIQKHIDTLEEKKADKLSATDIEMTLPEAGLILKSPNGTKWEISVSNEGVLETTLKS